MLRERANTHKTHLYFNFSLALFFFQQNETCFRSITNRCKCFESAKFPGAGGINKKPDKDIWDTGIRDKVSFYVSAR